VATFAHESRCDLDWCRAWHGPSDGPGHIARLALWRLGNVTVEVFAGQVDLHPPVVRIIRLYDDGRQRIRELDLELAAELADILDVLPGRTGELAAALRTAAEALGT
jgi:hypothetical protein